VVVVVVGLGARAAGALRQDEAEGNDGRAARTAMMPNEKLPPQQQQLQSRAATGHRSPHPSPLAHPHRARKSTPFFLYAYLDEDIIVGRGRSGGLALWQRADPAWCADAGVLQVYK